MACHDAYGKVTGISEPGSVLQILQNPPEIVSDVFRDLLKMLNAVQHDTLIASMFEKMKGAHVPFHHLRTVQLMQR